MTSAPIHLSQRAILRLSGPDSRSFLQGLITNDITLLTDDNLLYAALLTPQGKYLFDFILSQDGEYIYLDCEKERASDLARRLVMYRLRADVDITDMSEDLAVFALMDKEALSPEIIKTALTCGDDPRHPGLGLRFIMPKDGLSSFSVAPLEEYEQRRLSLGIPDASRDFQIDKTLILEGNIDELHGVSFTKGCYVGQELTARTKHRGKVRKRLLPVKLNGPCPPAGTEITDGTHSLGELRSGSGDIALAYLRMEDIHFGGTYDCAGTQLTVLQPDWWPSSAPQGNTHD